MARVVAEEKPWHQILHRVRDAVWDWIAQEAPFSMYQAGLTVTATPDREKQTVAFKIAYQQNGYHEFSVELHRDETLHDLQDRVKTNTMLLGWGNHKR